jgi:hypothetical protein
MKQNDLSNTDKEGNITSKLTYAVFKATSLESNLTCLQSNIEHYKDGKKYSIYTNFSLLRVLAQKVGLITDELNDKIYSTKKSDELTIILNWSEALYAYVTIDLKNEEDASYLSIHQKEIITNFHNILESDI